MDLSALFPGELQKLKTRIEKEIDGCNKKLRGQTMDEIESIGDKCGLKLEDVISNPATRKPRNSAAKAVAKSAKSANNFAAFLYRHSENPSSPGPAVAAVPRSGSMTGKPPAATLTKCG